MTVLLNLTNHDKIGLWIACFLFSVILLVIFAKWTQSYKRMLDDGYKKWEQEFNDYLDNEFRKEDIES